VDSTLSQKSLYFNYRTFGASCLFLNGKKIAQFGNPSSNPNEEYIPGTNKLFERFSPINLNQNDEYVIAIRYSIQDIAFHKMIDPSFHPIQVSIAIYDYDSFGLIIQEINQFINGMLISVVFLFLVMLLHLSLHIRFKEEKGNFWVFLISFFLFLPPFYYLTNLWGFIPLKLGVILTFFDIALFMIPILITPLCISKLVDVHIHRIWSYIPVIITALVLFISYSGIMPESEITLMVPLALLITVVGIIQVIIKGKKRNQRYFWLIIVSMVSYPIIFTVGIFIFDILSLGTYVMEIVTLVLIFTALPSGFSVYQTLRFFDAHGNLENEVKDRTSELEHAYIRIESSLSNLKSTQTQLIQAEKMASLGELTAGIAHEIQNPLNFVNNFSELSTELIDELNEEVDKGDLEEVRFISSDIKKNLEKITHHGKRADSIVKGMLAHSRSGKGEKELTNINELADEYLKLSYHGMRAKNNTFNTEFKTDFDADLPKINVIPQDIGRVLLNLINNAFQASAGVVSPLVQVSTKRMESVIEISVSDNGPGIPDNIKDKIFQPFFTTKPTGQGTGLGLSLSYDIVKAHGGSLEAKSMPGETVFTISLS